MLVLMEENTLSSIQAQNDGGEEILFHLGLALAEEKSSSSRPRGGNAQDGEETRARRHPLQGVQRDCTSGETDRISGRLDMDLLHGRE